jgi:hypothetical protein
VLSKDVKIKTHRPAILVAVLHSYGCATGSFDLRAGAEEKGELTGELRQGHDEEFDNLYCSTNIIRIFK